MKTLRRSRMTLRQLEQTAEFQALPVQQKLWLQTFIQSLRDTGKADALLATQVAFHNTGENARTLGYKVLRQKKLRAALKVWRNFGRSKREIFLADLQDEIDESVPGSAARSRLQLLYSQTMLGFPLKTAKTKRTRK
jgi:hypothetical protein